VTERRGFSLVEILVALAILTAAALPMLSLSPGRVLSYGPRQSKATYLLRELVEMAGAIPRARLAALLDASAHVGNGYREVAPAKLGLDAQAVAALEARFFVRLNAHVLGQFGLDRMDCIVSFTEAGRVRWLARSAVKRDEAALDALAELRVNGPFDRVDEGAFGKSIRTMAEIHANHVVAFQRADSPFVVPVLHPRVQTFMPPSFDEERLGAVADHLEEFQDAVAFVQGADLPAGAFPRPPIAGGVGVGH
jgi:prepilin-type N-terminal cleavage/methylation domain-containing protein